MVKRKISHFHMWHFLVWLVPGSIACWMLRDSVPFVSFMSWYAIVVTLATMWSARRAEESIEEEREDLEEFFHQKEEKDE